MSARGWAALAAVVYAAGLVALFGLRTWQHRRATGSSGFNGFAGRDGWARTAGLLFATAVLAGAAALVLTAAGTTRALIPLGLVQPLAVAGLLMVMGGLGLAWAAQSSMGSSWRIGVDPGETTELVTTGVFSRARNPIFTAMVAAQAGTVLMAPSWLSLAALSALVVAIELQVRRVEEPYLRKTHGAGYLDYSARVGRFVPLIGRIRTASTLPAVRTGTSAAVGSLPVQHRPALSLPQIARPAAGGAHAAGSVLTQSSVLTLSVAPTTTQEGSSSHGPADTGCSCAPGCACCE